MVKAVIKKYFKLLLSLSLTASLGFALIVGLAGGYLSLKTTLDKYLSDYAYPDAYISTGVTSVSEAENLLKIPGVTGCDTRLCGNTMMKTEDGEYLAARIFSYQDAEKQKYYFWDKTDLGEQEGVLLEYHYADSHNIKTGDTVYFQFRDEYRPLLVEGIVSRPETLYTKISDDAWGINYDFGYVFAPVDLLTKEYEKDYGKAEEELDENAKELENEWNSANDLLQKKEKELADAKALLAQQEQNFQIAKAEAEASVLQLNATRQELLNTLTDLDQKQAEAEKKYVEIEGIKNELLSFRGSLSDAEKWASEYKDVLDAIPFSFSDLGPDFSDKIREAIRLAEEEAEKNPELAENEQIQKLKDYLPLLDEIVVEMSKTGEWRIGTVYQVIDGKIAECESGFSQIREAENEINQGREQILAGISEIDQMLVQIDEQLRGAEEQIDDARRQIQSGEAELKQKTADALKEFADLEAELDEAYQKLNDEESYDSLCNQFLLYFDDNADSETLLKLAEAALPEDLTITSSYVYKDSPIKERIDDNLKPLYSLAVICPWIFYLVTLGILFLFMSMIIKQSRRDIGILRALGFTKTRIRAMFCFVSLLVAVAGLLIGAGIALGLLHYIGNYFKDFFPLPLFYYQLDARWTAIGVFATIFVCLIAALITTSAISRFMPKEAMSRPVRQRISVPGWVNRITGKMKPINKFSLTSLLRNKGRFLFAAFCTAVSVMLILAAVSFIAAKNEVIRQTFDDRIHYNCQIFLEDAPETELLDQLNSLGYLSDVEELLYYDVPVTSASGEVEGIVNAIEPETSLIGIQNGKNQELSVREGEIILTRIIAEELGVSEGETVQVNGVSFYVSGLSEQSANWTQYISLKDAERIGKPDLGCVLCNFPEDKKQDLLSSLTENETNGYLYTIFMDSFYEYNMELFNTYDTAAWILIAFSILIGFIIILNTSMTNMQELKHELCVLMSLGFHYREISKSRISHIVLQFLLAAPVGVAAGIIFAKKILLAISSAGEIFSFASGFKEYAITLGLVLAYLLFSHFISVLSMKKWDLVENVKDKE